MLTLHFFPLLNLFLVDFLAISCDVRGEKQINVAMLYFL